MKPFMKLAALTAASALMLGACADAKEPEAVAPAASPATEIYAEPAVQTSQDPESDAVLADVRNMVLDRDDFRVSLGALDAWVKGKPEGYARWGIQTAPQGEVLMLAVTYRYDTGELADYMFAFGPINGSAPLPLLMGYRGEQRLSKADTDSILDGFVLDMYHQGLEN